MNFDKSKRVFELAISFWAGVGLMSLINIIKLLYTPHSLLYSLIMLAVSIIFIIISLALYLRKPIEKTEGNISEEA